MKKRKGGQYTGGCTKIKKRDRNSKKGHREVNSNKQMVNKNFAPGQNSK